MRPTLFLPLFLAVSCSPVMAEWVKISSNEQSVFYLESAVSKKVGSNVMIWTLRDHKEIRYGSSGQPYRSTRDQIEVDCSRRRIRKIYSSDHPKPMGEGKFVSSEHGPMSWNDASPRTIVDRMVSIACANA